MTETQTSPETEPAFPAAPGERLLKLSFPVAILALAAFALLASTFAGPILVQMFLIMTGSVLTTAAAWFAAMTLRQRLRRNAIVETLEGVIASSENPTYISDETGVILLRNSPARNREDRRNIPDMRAAFADLRVTADVLDRCRPDALFLPCPPVTRGEEVSADAMEHPTCRVVEAKAWLLHAQNALLVDGLAG